MVQGSLASLEPQERGICDIISTHSPGILVFRFQGL